LGAGRRPCLLDWLAVHHPAWADPDAYVPRGLVGEYLSDAFSSLTSCLPPGLQVTPVRATVVDLSPAADGWLIHHDDTSADRHVHAVVCTVGHGTWRASLATSENSTPAWLPSFASARLVSQVYPVQDALRPDRVPPGAVVALRGFALTALDVALALTVGRGGRVEGLDDLSDAGAPWPRYVAGCDQVARLVPWSRSGAPLLAKPGPVLVARSAALEDVWTDLRARLAVADGPDRVQAIARELGGAARTALVRLGVTPDAALDAALMALLDVDGSAGTDLHDGPRALAAMRCSVEVAVGRRPDAAWAVGEAWRQGYPALVARIGHGGLLPADRPRFAGLARRLERVAFGPPAENLARLIALVDAGLVDLRWLGSGPRPADPPLDVVVDTVLPPPGVDTSTPVWGRLVAAGLARTAAGTTGIEVEPDGTCIGRDGTPTRGLAGIGRATEGWVLGNDTLHRTLHPETAAWARAVLDGVRRQDDVCVAAVGRR
jgi:hypothetical protein